MRKYGGGPEALVCEVVAWDREVKVYPVYGVREWRYSSIYLSARHYIEVDGQIHAPDGEIGPKTQSGRFGEQKSLLHL
jgi:hypothetical protein